MNGKPSMTMWINKTKYLEDNMITIFIKEDDLDSLKNNQPVQYWFQQPGLMHPTIQVLLTYEDLIALRELNEIFEEQKRQAPLPF